MERFLNPRLKKCSIITLGCPKNQVDSEVLAGELTRQGLELVRNAKEADAVFINTCGFIEDAKKESIDAILRAVENKKRSKNQKVYVWGCLSERYKNGIEKEIPEVDRFFGIEPFDEIGRHVLGSSYRFCSDAYCHRMLSTPPHTAYLKISDGCDHQCTFCAIPQFKGRYRSRPAEDILREAESLVHRGVKELILVAQDTTAYGSDLANGTGLVDLLKRLVEIDPLKWVRILYAHPSHVTGDLIRLMADEKKICRYLDMPLQHISDRVLKAMGRGLRRKQIEERIDRLRSEIPGLVLRTAFIVGFPGETERAFAELADFVREMRFERLGAFIYSSEEGTESYSMKQIVPRSVSEERYKILMEIQNRISNRNNRSRESCVLPIIVDGYDENQQLYFGRSEGDSLDIDQTVWIQGKVNIGEIVPVQIQGSEAYDLMGTVIF
jgi:ribosomal protein S12 methylthiotransferase